MFIDASALVAVLRREEDANELEQRIVTEAAPPYVSAIVRYEATLAVSRVLSMLPENGNLPRQVLIDQAKSLVEAYLDEIEARDIAIDKAIGNAALEAAASYGKAVGHKAGLNMGDCFAYACAKTAGVPLLYKGNDFSETDLA